MAEKPSPSSTITSGGSHDSAATPQSVTRSSSSPRVLVVRQPPTHVFSDEWFEVEFDIQASRGKGTLEDVEFVATLHSQKSGRAAGDGTAFTVAPMDPIRFSLKESPSKRKRTLRFKIRPKEVTRDRLAAFFILLSVKDDRRSVGILPASTHQICIVNYKVNISLNEEWERVWYKDEGGREKCMTVIATILNKAGAPLVGAPVPLQTTLFYGNGEQPVRVSKQGILRTVGASKQVTDKVTGKATLRFRVEDVSKNHQGQDFRVEVAVDAKAKGFYDIAPAFTPPVAVRSKRNKRQRASASAFKSQPARYGSPVTSARGTVYMSNEPPRGAEAAFSGADVQRIRDAVRGVKQWAEDVVNGLLPLQWQVIGYAQNPDGTSDFSRPYHNMQNPNEYISRVLSTYSDSTQEHLRYLSNELDKSSPSPHGDAGLPSSSARAPEFDLMMPPGLPPSGPYPMDQRSMPLGMPMHASALPRGSYLGGPHSHPLSVPHDAFRDKGGMGSPMFPSQAAHGGPQAPMPLHPTMGGTMRMGDMGSTPMQSQVASLPQDTGAQSSEPGKSEAEPPQAEREFEVETRESEVAYVLARQFKAMRTGERLGFPAYSESKELLGFYRESSMKVGVGQFIPISRHREDFGPVEVMEATQILDEAMDRKSDAVYALKDWGSISNLIDHALVYDWSKDIGTAETNNSGSSGNTGE